MLYATVVFEKLDQKWHNWVVLENLQSVLSLLPLGLAILSNQLYRYDVTWLQSQDNLIVLSKKEVLFQYFVKQ